MKGKNMNKLHVIGAAALVGAIAAGCSKQESQAEGPAPAETAAQAVDDGRDVNEVVVEVNGKKLTHGMLLEDVAKIVAAQGGDVPKDQVAYMRQMLRNQLAQKFLVENAMIDKAKAEGYVVTDAERKEREEKFLKNAAGAPDAPKSFAEVAEKYPLGKDRAYADFENGILIDKMLKAESAKIAATADYAAKAQEIIDNIVSNNAANADADAKALESIKAIKAELDAEGVDVPAKFAELAKDRSSCPSSSKGGDLGEFTLGMMVPEFDKAAFELPVGKVSEPVKTQFGYHLIMVTEKKPAVEAADGKPGEPEQVRASHILVKGGDTRPVPKADEVIDSLKRGAERENVQKTIVATIKAAAVKVADEFKNLLPPDDEPKAEASVEEAPKAGEKPAEAAPAEEPKAEEQAPVETPAEK